MSISLSSADLLRPSGFLEIIIGFLLPYFMGQTTTLEEARAEILDTLAAYPLRSRPDALKAARIIAFGMAALDTLYETQVLDMPESMRIRYRSCANSLNRTVTQMEKSLDDKRPAKPAEPAVESAADTPVAAADSQPSTPPVARNERIHTDTAIKTLKQTNLPVHPASPADPSGGYDPDFSQNASSAPVSACFPSKSAAIR